MTEWQQYNIECLERRVKSLEEKGSGCGIFLLLWLFLWVLLVFFLVAPWAKEERFFEKLSAIYNSVKLEDPEPNPKVIERK